MSQALNYLRQAKECLNDGILSSLADRFPLDAIAIKATLEIASASQKFVLPDNGRIFDDALRGLPELLKLPYPTITVEYRSSLWDGNDIGTGGMPIVEAPKRMIVAVQQDEWVQVFAFVYSARSQSWNPLPYFASVAIDGDYHKQLVSGAVSGDMFAGLKIQLGLTGTMAEALAGNDWKRNAMFDLKDEIRAILELIEALSCSNVSFERIPKLKMNKNALRRGALPFDDYWTLVVKSQNQGQVNLGGTHRSPREHLRRGHIRRLSPGKKIWVNSTVVSAGKGGKICKTYQVPGQYHAAA